MLSAGTCVEWLRDDLGIIETAAESAAVAADCEQTDDVWFVPALLGLGTPVWDFGARGTILGLTRGSGRAQVVRAVLEGVAHRGADLLEAAELDSGLAVPALRVDGGMSDNDVFTQALADACGRTVEIAPVTEATTLGAAFLAGMATGHVGGRGRGGGGVAAPAGDRAGRGRGRPRRPAGPLARGSLPGRGDHPRALGHRLLTAVGRQAGGGSLILRPGIT